MTKTPQTLIAFVAALSVVLTPTLSQAMGALATALRSASTATATSSAAARVTLGVRPLRTQTTLGAGTVGVLGGLTAEQALGLSTPGVRATDLEHLMNDPGALRFLRDQALARADFQTAVALEQMIAEREDGDPVRRALTRSYEEIFGFEPNPHLPLNLQAHASGGFDRLFSATIAPSSAAKPAPRVRPRRTNTLEMVRRGQGFTATFQESCQENDTAVEFVMAHVSQTARHLVARTVGARRIGAEDLAQSFWENFAAMCARFEARSDRETMGYVKTVLRNNLKALILNDGRQILAVQPRPSRARTARYTVVPVIEGSGRVIRDGTTEPQAVEPQARFDEAVLDRIDVARMAQSMTEDQRKALAHRMTGKTHAEIGAAMRIPPQRVKQLLREARSTARAYLEAGTRTGSL